MTSIADLALARPAAGPHRSAPTRRAYLPLLHKIVAINVLVVIAAVLVTSLVARLLLERSRRKLGVSH